MALKKDIGFKESETNDFSTSWQKSVDSSNELLVNVANLKLHDVQETAKLNETRNILMELARPIAEISQNIQINIKLAMDKKNELENGHFNEKDLQNELMITQIDLQPKGLGNVMISYQSKSKSFYIIKYTINISRSSKNRMYSSRMY